MSTSSNKFKSSERYRFGWTNPRGCFGSMDASKRPYPFDAGWKETTRLHYPTRELAEEAMVTFAPMLPEGHYIRIETEPGGGSITGFDVVVLEPPK